MFLFVLFYGGLVKLHQNDEFKNTGYSVTVTVTVNKNKMYCLEKDTG